MLGKSWRISIRSSRGIRPLFFTKIWGSVHDLSHDSLVWRVGLGNCGAWFWFIVVSCGVQPTIPCLGRLLRKIICGSTYSTSAIHPSNSTYTVHDLEYRTGSLQVKSYQKSDCILIRFPVTIHECLLSIDPPGNRTAAAH